MNNAVEITYDLENS